MSLKSPLGRVLGLGSAKDGTATWWTARLTSMALVPLSLWVLVALCRVPLLDYDTAVALIRLPANAVAFALFVLVAGYHSMHGLHEVIEDYVHVPGAKVAALVGIDFVHVVAVAAGLYAVLKVSFGGVL